LTSEPVLAGSCWNRRTVSTCWTVWRMTVFLKIKKKAVQTELNS